MPYNFEATFTQPILAQLDNGLIDGADSWAEAITNAYYNTIQTGLPQGVPATLPAPGLNPTAPPPFPIGPSGFVTADPKKELMYNTIRAYYLAKEFSLSKASIEGTIVTVKQLIRKIKVRYSQVQALIVQAQLISKELAELPRRLQDIIADIKEEIKEQIENLNGVFRTTNNFQVEFGEDEYRRIFAEELRLFETIKSFNLASVAGIRDLAFFVVQHTEQLERQLVVSSPQQLAKKYLRDKLFAVAKEFLKFADAVVDPTKIIDFLKGLASGRDRIKRVYEKVKRLDFFVRYIQPKLSLIRKRIKDKLADIRDNAQKKLVDIQIKLQEKIAENAKKRKDSKAVNLYKNAKKDTDNLKKQNKEKIKKIRTKVRLTLKGIKITAKMIGKVTSLIEGAKYEFQSIKEDIVNFQQSIEQQVALLSQAGQNIILSNAAVVPPLPAPSVPPQNINQLATVLNQMDDRGTLIEVQKVKAYFEQSRLGQYANIAALVITQTKCTFQTFKRFFEAKRDTIRQYVKEIKDLERDFEELKDVIKELRDPESKRKPETDKPRKTNWLNNRIKSVFDFLRLIGKWLQPRLAQIEKWFKKKLAQYETAIKDSLKKFQDNLEIFALNLVPLKSDVQDVKDKAAVAEDKRLKLQDKLRQVQKLLRQTSFIIKMAAGATSFAANIAVGNYKFSDNQFHIKRFLDGYYLFRSEDKPPTVQEQLQQEKVKVENDLKGLVIIESVAYAFIETYKDIAQGGFLQELRDIIDDLKDNIPGKRALEALFAAFSAPLTSIKQVVDIANTITLNVLEDVSIVTRLVQLEMKYLRKSREAIKSLCDIKRLEGTKTEKALLKIKSVLDKNQSFILAGIKFIQQQLKNLFRFIGAKLKKIPDNVRKKQEKKREKIEEKAKLEGEKIIEKKVNAEAPIMTFVFGLAARLFWTGAVWTGQTGTQHVVFNIGTFTPIKAKSTDGASGMIREMAKGFENQLKTMSGLLTPPANTGIPPIPFTGYN